MEEDLIVAQTQKWIMDVVVGLNFCPFAAREMKLNKVRYVVMANPEPEITMHALLEECERLDMDEETETTLLLLPMGYDDFEDFLDLAAYAEDIIEQNDYEGVYQVASFHPKYIFADAEVNDPANYTNRSPYPMLHLLRESSIDRAIEKYQNHEEIPEKNIQTAREKGLAYMQALRDACINLN